MKRTITAMVLAFLVLSGCDGSASLTTNDPSPSAVEVTALPTGAQRAVAAPSVATAAHHRAPAVGRASAKAKASARQAAKARAAAHRAAVRRMSVRAAARRAAKLAAQRRRAQQRAARQRAARQRAARQRAAAQQAANCTPGYSPCIPPASDVDCAGGSGNGPAYVQGPVRVTGSDPYDLDRDGDGVGCDS